MQIINFTTTQWAIYALCMILTAALISYILKFGMRPKGVFSFLYLFKYTSVATLLGTIATITISDYFPSLFMSWVAAPQVIITLPFYAMIVGWYIGVKFPPKSES
jgi:hypothetical protein